MLNVKPSWKNWQLLTEKGRQIWAFKPKSNNINEHLQNVASVTDEDIVQFAEDFQFDKSSNPNSADKVFRHAAINANFQEFSGQNPQESNADQQQVTDALVKGINYFSCLQSEDGHWPGDYGGPLFLLPGLLIASYLTESPFPKAHQE
ncbi:MAG: hypothetical protein Q8Q40_04395, partial [Methylococcaceae bacterium]|nr:hypothetical protein [Methylococcaceae bacterium]